jgi:hypothetical protein
LYGGGSFGEGSLCLNTEKTQKKREITLHTTVRHAKITPKSQSGGGRCFFQKFPQLITKLFVGLLSLALLMSGEEVSEVAEIL